MGESLPSALPCPRCGKRPTWYETEPFVKGYVGLYCQDRSHDWEPVSAPPAASQREAITNWNKGIKPVEKEKGE
jgi:hypothetical protein